VKWRANLSTFLNLVGKEKEASSEDEEVPMFFYHNFLDVD